MIALEGHRMGEQPAADLHAEALDLMTVDQLVQAYPALRKRTVQQWIMDSRPRHVSIGGVRRQLPGNGLGPAVHRVGRKIWIKRTLFLRWWLGEGEESVQ